MLGATGTANRVTFETQQISAIEALASVGGLDPLRADPKGVFIFRDERPEIATEILGIGQFVTDVRFVYVLDLTKPTGMFDARGFQDPRRRHDLRDRSLFGSLGAPDLCAHRVAHRGRFRARPRPKR